MNKIFLTDGDSEYTYGQLADDLSAMSTYCNVYRYSNLYDFYLNLLSALISDSPITLIDADISDAELSALNIQEIDSTQKIAVTAIYDFKDLSARVRGSKSTISIFTSGTTGQPKKVDHSINTLTRAAKVSDKHSNDIWGFAYNPTHMAGLQVFFQAFLNQNQIVNIFGLGREDVMKKIETCNISHISATPTFYRLLKPYEKDFKSVSRITLGGEKSDGKLYSDISALFPNAKITNVYASTEAGTLLAAYGSDFKIKDDMTDVFKVANDELLIHKSLVGNSDTFKFDGDFYCTGDLIEWIDEPNHIFRFKSRKNELINVGGYKVNPNEVEECIRAIAGVTNARVYGRKNSILGNILCAEIVKEQSSKLSVDYIHRILKEKLQDFKIPRKITFVDHMDTTRTGKLKR